MSQQVTFFGTMHNAAGLVPAALDASLTAPTNVTNLQVGAANGTQIIEIDFSAVGTVVAGRINIFQKDGGGTFHLYDQVMVVPPTNVPSATQEVWRQVYKPDNLILASGWTLCVSVMEAGNQSLISMVSTGADA